MAKPDKARIIYEVNGVESELRFHSVIAEEHEASNEITKFPVQSGFNVSNHAIRKNRVVSITGVVSNHQIVGAEEFNSYDDSNNVVRLVFEVLKDIVRGAIPCEVVTNFGKYNPVIFTRIKTRLAAGKTDVMEFTIRGEEVQLATTINGNKPTLLVFTPLSNSDKEARVIELAAAGIDVPEGAVLSETSVNLEESFQVESVDDLGNTSITTYEKVATDLTSESVSHLVSTTITDLTDCVDTSGASISNLNLFAVNQAESSLPNNSSTSGASTVSSCITGGTRDFVSDAVEDTVCTALGELQKSAYGAMYSITGVNGNQSAGQALLGVGVDCVVAGVTGSDLAPLSDMLNMENLVSVDQVLEGASNLGANLLDSASGNISTVLTKISPPTQSSSFLGDLG